MPATHDNRLSSPDPQFVDQLQLRWLVESYAAAIDRQDIDSLVELFVADGTLTGYVSNAEVADYEFRGRTQIRGLSSRWTFRQTIHDIANHVCSVTSVDEAIGETYCLAHHLVDDQDSAFDRVLAVNYYDCYVREDGVWKISARVLRRLWSNEIGTSDLAPTRQPPRGTNV
jgi:hypothetical protein